MAASSAVVALDCSANASLSLHFAMSRTSRWGFDLEEPAGKRLIFFLRRVGEVLGMWWFWDFLLQARDLVRGTVILVRKSGSCDLFWVIHFDLNSGQGVFSGGECLLQPTALGLSLSNNTKFLGFVCRLPVFLFKLYLVIFSHLGLE